MILQVLADPVTMLGEVRVRAALAVPSGYDKPDYNTGMCANHPQCWYQIRVVGYDYRMVDLASQCVMVSVDSQIDIALLLLELPYRYAITVTRLSLWIRVVDKRSAYLCQRIVPFDDLNTAIVQLA
ncbi:hypothetical protein WI92_01570 [Burkholderia vietnamiensis]|nr:hypothetical protein WI92_01570 [Burkholderia vietnamiensis]